MVQLYFLLLYTALAVIVGLLGDGRKLGFWGYFFASLLLSPLLGMVLVMASDPIDDDEMIQIVAKRNNRKRSEELTDKP